MVTKRAATKWVAALASTAMIATACTGGGSDDSSAPTTTVPGASTTPVVATGATSTTGGDVQLGFRLSEGRPTATDAAQTPVVAGEALTEAEIAAVLARLPEWDVPGSDVAEFNRPAATLTPPTVGDTIDRPFPPVQPAPTAPDAVASGPLEVLRTQPTGDVSIAPFIAITFNEPMVPLATLDQLDAAEVPVTVTPDIAAGGLDGRWRWIGTRTLRFEVTPTPGADAGAAGLDRLPASTDFTVTVPAGTESANGAVLADDVTFTFSTPAVTVTGFVGLDEVATPLDPVFVATFDQRVDPASIVERIDFESGDVNAVRLATADEIENDDVARAAVDAALEDRSVAFVPTSTLAPDQAINIAIGPDLPSLEGPVTSGDVSRQTGRTYAPLEVSDISCDDRCPPQSSFGISFNNPLDVDAFDPTLITVEPAVPGLRVDNYGNSLSITGVTNGSTTYTVTIGGGIADVYGQTLGDDYSHEFEVGTADPFYVGPDRQFVTTDPFAATAGVNVTTVNHDRLAVTAWQVRPDQYGEFGTYLDSTYSDREPADPDWPVVLDTTVEIDASTDAITETSVDLEAAFDASGGPLVVRIQPDPPARRNSDEYYRNAPSYTWVQRTTIAADVFITDTELLVWVTDLLTGAPVADATIDPIGGSAGATTDASGTVRLPLSGTINGIVATAGDRTTMTPAPWFNAWQRYDSDEQNRTYVVSDRGIYRPGETVRMTGLVRQLDGDAQLAFVDGSAEVRYTAYDAQGAELESGTAALNVLGGFNISIELAAGANAGSAFVDLSIVGAPSSGFAHQFEIQDFRTPDFEVTARPESGAPYYVGAPATIAADANYFAGGPLGDAQVDWNVSTSSTSYSPPGWGDFTFGVWTPWWYGADAYSAVDVAFEECFDCFPGGPTVNSRQYTGRTNAAGSHYLQIDFADGLDADDAEQPGLDQPALDQPSTVTAEATVYDVNRQAIASRTTLLVHPARYYVGLRNARSFVEQGQPIEVDTTIVDIDGNAVAGRTVTLTAGRLESRYDAGRYVEELLDPQTCTVTSSATTNADPDPSMRCTFTTDVGGQYQITAVVTDDDGRSNRAVTTQWVSGSTAPPTRGLTQGAVVIVPDAEFYAPGDAAELLVQAPFAPASGLMIVTRAGVESVTAFDAADGSAVLTVPIADDDIPNLDVRIDMVGTEPRLDNAGIAVDGAPDQPAYAVGQISLQIPPVARTLTVDARAADDQLAPGDATSVEVTVTDASGAPVADAGVALIVVDEAVLSLTGYQLPDPLDAFYGTVSSRLDPQLLRASIILANPDIFGPDSPTAGGDAATEEAASDESFDAAATTTMVASEPAPAEGEATRAGVPAAPDAPIDVRADFSALAVFAPDETTGDDGTVSVAVDLPDSLTRYRIMAVAVDGVDRFGSGESSLTAQLPISVRPSAPRFLNFGDRFELPVVVQNLTDSAIEVDVALEVANLELTDGAGRRVTVPANDRVEIRFPAAAADVGTARFRVAVAAATFADAAEVSLPVYTPATAEAFATYGVIDGNGSTSSIAQPLLAPTGVVEQFGGLEVSTSSTALQALTDAVLYLYDYRYDSADGFASRITAVAALRDVLDAFDADGLPDAAALEARVNADVTALQALQNDDGGFPYWQRGSESIPWMSVQATLAQVLAKENGFSVDQFTLDVSLDHLRNIESFIPSEYSPSTRDAIIAEALYVRMLAGDADPVRALGLYRSGVDSTLELDAIARLWTVIDDAAARSEIERTITNAAVETAGAAAFATDYGEDAYLIANSDRRTDGVILDALVRVTPTSDLIPKVVNGLLGNQTRGRWNNAPENSSILLALNEYFDTFESVDPDFVANAWLGDTYVATQEFRGRSTDTARTLVPMSELIGAASGDGGQADLVLALDGDGRMYYRLGLRYAPDDLTLAPRDEGFVVERTYEAVDDADDVRRNADGSWDIAAGATVRVRLTMVADAQRTQVALVDPLPAGFEAINPSLSTSGTVAPDDTAASSDGWWYWQWFQHQNLRTDRVEAFTSYLPGGTYEYSYVARATTPGEFVVPPARAEEIYAPEVFGRSASENVVITER